MQILREIFSFQKKKYMIQSLLPTSFTDKFISFFRVTGSE